jgi:hypothetical protein
MGEMFRGFNESMLNLQGRTDQGPQGVKESFYRHVFKDPLIPGGFETDEFPRYGVGHRRPGRMPGSNTSCEPIRRLSGTAFHTTPGANHVFSIHAKITILLWRSVIPIAIIGHDVFPHVEPTFFIDDFAYPLCPKLPGFKQEMGPPVFHIRYTM